MQFDIDGLSAFFVPAAATAASFFLHRQELKERILNAARVLLNFFGSGSSTIRFRDLINAYAEVSRFFSEAKADGDEKASIVVEWLPNLWDCIAQAFDGCAEYVGPYMGVEFSSQCRMSLLIAEEMLDGKTSTYSAIRREKVKQLLDSLPDELDQLSLPQELHLYVLRLAREVRVALDEYAITGDFKLDAAFSRLQSQLFVVATHLPNETQQNRFVQFLTDKFIPCMTALSLTITSASGGMNLKSMIAQQIQSSALQTSTSSSPPRIPQLDPWTEQYNSDPESDET